MANAKYRVPFPSNEPIKNYAPKSPERAELKATLARLKEKQIEIPLIIGGQEIKTDKVGHCVVPHDHQRIIGTYCQAGKKEVQMAIEAALEARKHWAAMDWHDRASVFLKAGQLLAGPWRSVVNGSSVLGQSKTAYQAEIDAACELIDFLRFNCFYAMEVFEEQPAYSPTGIWNRMDYRPLEGFVFAATPFNFASIAGNLPSAPAIVGNVSLWKPASNAVYTAYHTMRVFEEAGLPDGVINFLPGPGATVGPDVMASPHLAGIHFTGSTDTLQSIWETVGRNIRNYRSYPRIVGETGGKDFVIAHKSAHIEALGVALIRGAYEYQGQKCSAASRAYIPKGIWGDLKDFMTSELKTVKVGDPEDFTNFMTAVIDKAAFTKISGYIESIKKSAEAEIVFGGGYDDSKGFFIEPTLAITTNPHFRTMEEEIFGPVLTVYVYQDDKYEEILHLCDKTSPYGLTGSIFAQDRQALVTAEKILVNAAGNFYINDKPTASIVAQQPFGGSRASGTNDKSGSRLNTLRWVTPRTVKETFVPPLDYRYPFMMEK
jgi:1-pyrroline-5-carboxylate dehydrogenase